MSSLADKTIKEFGDILASNKPAPGGGSAAALSGLLGASLILMVANLSFGKKQFEELGEEAKADFKKEYEKTKQLKDCLEGLVDRDTEAFNGFMAAMKMPKDTEADREKRTAAIQSASLRALEIPLETAQKCLEILQNQSTIARYGSSNAVSDIGVGVLLACAGLDGAILNVRINLPGIADERAKSDAEMRIAEYQKLASWYRSEIMEIVEERLS